MTWGSRLPHRRRLLDDSFIDFRAGLIAQGHERPPRYNPLILTRFQVRYAVAAASQRLGELRL